MTAIQLPDFQVAALAAKAAAEGLTLEAWLGQLATTVPRRGARTGRVRYSLEELVAQCDPSAPMSGEDAAWLNDQPVGREAI